MNSSLAVSRHGACPHTLSCCTSSTSRTVHIYADLTRHSCPLNRRIMAARARRLRTCHIIDSRRLASLARGVSHFSQIGPFVFRHARYLLCSVWSWCPRDLTWGSGPCNWATKWSGTANGRTDPGNFLEVPVYTQAPAACWEWISWSTPASAILDRSCYADSAVER